MQIATNVLAVFLFAGAANADHAWSTYHWARPANPFTIQVGDNVTSGWDDSLTATCADWSTVSPFLFVTNSMTINCNNAANPVRLTRVNGSSNARRCAAKSGTIQVCNSTYGNNGWLGLASISVSGSHITAGTVKVNDTYYNTASYNTPAWRQLVMAQEVGHCLGLNHQDENNSNADVVDACGRGSCMDYSNDPTNQGTPNGHDYDQLVTIYNHADTTTTIASGLPSTQGNVGFDISDRVDPENPATWGRPIGSRNGRMNLFERKFGPDLKVITHVFWIE